MPMPGPRPRTDEELRALFDSKVRRTDGCWLWTGTTNPQGYGLFSHRRHQLRAHRYAYERFVGPIPEGQIVMHACDTPRCVRPDHLSVGTHADNQRDKRLRGRAARGEANAGGGKLTRFDIHAIRLRLKRGETMTALGRDFGVSRTCIGKIKRGELWSHVEER